VSATFLILFACRFRFVRVEAGVFAAPRREKRTLETGESQSRKKSMKTSHLIALATVAVLFCSCIPSVNPFYTEKDIVFDPRLLGEWQSKGKSDGTEPIWKFETTGTNAYRLTVTDKQGKQGKFNARLFKLEKNCFLDLVPANCEYATNQTDLVAASMLPGHLLVWLPQLEPGLKLALFDFDWLEKHLNKDPKALAHRTEDGRIVLTDDTRHLQRFVLKHLGEGGLFETPDEMARKVTAPPAAAREPAR
jgi:hypothetical protein